MKRFWQLGWMSAVLGVAPICGAQPATAPATVPAIDYTAVYPRARDIRAFARARPAEGGVPYSLAVSSYTSADVPELQAMLMDLKEAPDARMRAAACALRAGVVARARLTTVANFECLAGALDVFRCLERLGV